ncbi:hypothetical protein CIB95_10935 [Lottiidibacillus patelloidae]|uniref:YwgA family protein n=1 Tax=Lottiidibacillus patelloidae TaxID=2670334 RepID=A0A263BT31_9BACI|nr:YwgA family protein [Lottiidibacillus patelloidae]OZM56728.1 hypothetical protein CIB95_10935 [Lottiidibacillus patelloidae]
MLKDHAKLLALFQRAGEVVGRKKLQKIVYIAKKLNFPFNEKYQFHFYGPYSEEVTCRVEELCNFKFIEEVKEKKGGYFQYRYTLTPEGETFLSHHDVDMPALENVVSSMNGKSSRFLELVSTVLYFDELEKDEVKEKITTLKAKQRYTDDEIEEAYEYINLLTQLQTELHC